MNITGRGGVGYLAAALALALASGCRSPDEGASGTSDGSGGTDTDTGGDAPAASQPRTRRLSNHELGNTLEALTGVRPAALSW